MFKQNASDEISGCTQHKNNIGAIQTTQSNEEVLDAIDAMLDHPNAETELDVEKLKRYLDVLQERSPVAEDYMPGQVWNKLQDQIPEATEVAQDSEVPVTSQNRRKYLPLRKIGFIAACLTILLAMTTTALGFSPISMLFDWASGVVQIQGNPSGMMERTDVSAGEYRSLKDALESNGISGEELPTWIPADYAITDVTAQSVGSIEKYTGRFVGERGEFFIRVVVSDMENWSINNEMDSNGYIYEANQGEYYIVANYEEMKAGWISGDFAYTILGNVTEEELISMINSISKG